MQYQQMQSGRAQCAGGAGGLGGGSVHGGVAPVPGGGGIFIGGGGDNSSDVTCSTGCAGGSWAGPSCGQGCVVASSEVMTFVAPGEGEYITETSLRYVGTGGNISKVKVNGILWGRVALLITLLVVLLVAAVVYWPESTASTTHHHASTSVAPIVPEPIPVPEPVPVVFGECSFWGDPHVKSFDGARPSFYGDGEQWIVKSETVSIQGRYMGTVYTKGLAATNKVAVGGAFLKNHVIVVPTMEEGPITIDGVPKLQTFGQERIGDLATITYSAEGELVDEATSDWEKNVVHMELPLNVRLTIFRWKNYLDLRVRMQQQPGQDGACGNFDGAASDDTTEAIFARIGARVEQGRLLFRRRADVRLTPEEERLIDMCPRVQYENALRVCPKELQNFHQFPTNMEVRECVLDLCYGSNQHVLRTARAAGI